MTSVLLHEQVIAEQRKILMIIIIMNKTAKAMHKIQSQGGYHSQSPFTAIQSRWERNINGGTKIKSLKS